jgi:hypothetical protein
VDETTESEPLDVSRLTTAGLAAFLFDRPVATGRSEKALFHGSLSDVEVSDGDVFLSRVTELLNGFGVIAATSSDAAIEVGRLA